MNRVKQFLKDELSGWKKWQIFWMIFANAMILGISIYQKDTVLGIAASITGVICVILCGMGKVSNYIFGTANTILYAIVAWKAKYYGDVMLNLLYYLPTNIIGWVAWRKNINLEKNERLAEAIAALNSYDLILFLEPDVEWVQDGDRSEVIAADRKKYSEMIKALFTERGFPFKTITGDYNSRFDQAVSYVNELLSG